MDNREGFSQFALFTLHRDLVLTSEALGALTFLNSVNGGATATFFIGGPFAFEVLDFPVAVNLGHGVRELLVWLHAHNADLNARIFAQELLGGDLGAVKRHHVARFVFVVVTGLLIVLDDLKLSGSVHRCAVFVVQGHRVVAQ